MIPLVDSKRILLFSWLYTVSYKKDPLMIIHSDNNQSTQNFTTCSWRSTSSKYLNKMWLFINIIY